MESKQACSGTCKVKFFDEVQDNDKDISEIKPLFSVSVDHQVPRMDCGSLQRCRQASLDSFSVKWPRATIKHKPLQKKLFMSILSFLHFQQESKEFHALNSLPIVLCYLALQNCNCYQQSALEKGGGQEKIVLAGGEGSRLQKARNIFLH